MKRASTTSLLAFAAAAVLTTAGCTSSSGGTGNANTPAPTPTPSTSTSSTSSTPSSTAPVTTPPIQPVSSSSTARPSSWCVDGEITDGVTPNPDGGAAGHNGLVLTFTNSSTRTCVLYGYPGADALNSAGKVVAHAKRSLTGYIGGTYTGLTNVTLHPGQVASTILEGDIGDGGPSCSSGVSLVVTAPNLFHSTPLTGSVYTCDFTVHPVVAGNTGR